MLDALITSKTRLKLITRFFLNPDATAYLRGLTDEFGESTNAVRLELNRFEAAGLLESKVKGNKKMYNANQKHPLFKDLQAIVKKNLGIDRIVDNMIKELGGVKQAYLTGNFALGNDGQTIDVVIVGQEINKTYLVELVEKVENLISRKIRFLVLDDDEAENYLNRVNPKMLIWSS
jgi:predicted nucleotidyltransferase